MNSILDVMMRNINQLNETIVIMQTNIDNRFASNDLTLKAINETLQSVVKTPGDNSEYTFFIKIISSSKISRDFS